MKAHIAYCLSYLYDIGSWWRGHPSKLARVLIEIFLSSDPIQINGVKLLGNASEASMKHLKAMERRAIKLWGEATGKTIPLRMKKICMYNVSLSIWFHFYEGFDFYNCSGVTVIF